MRVHRRLQDTTSTAAQSAGGAYAKINSSLVVVLDYTDSNVQSGTTYYYVTTAVNSSGNESVFSNEVSGTIP